MSQLTTHILDTTLGKPAVGVSILLLQKVKDEWVTLAQGKTNADGRISDLLRPEIVLEKGVYRMTFDTGNYFKNQNVVTFYPVVTVEFEVNDATHYHVPLLLNPFGYSTYRGS